jgi:nucleoside diphosphate kinase
MAEELTYVLINPYALRKSRTGGIISRLLTRTSLDVAASRLFAPGKELAQEYAETFKTDWAKGRKDAGGNSEEVRQLLHDYVLTNYSPDPATVRRQRVLMLLFRGEDALAKVRECVGAIGHSSVTGETIRGTYGDYVLNKDGSVRYFEPAVLTPESPEELEATIRIWTRHSDQDGGLMENVTPCPRTPQTQRTLVMIKPDNFTFPSGKPGNVIDMFSRTGLYIVAFKVQRISVAQAEEFYGVVRPVLHEKFKEFAGQRAVEILSKEMGFALPSGISADLGKILGPLEAEHQFEEIVRFMSGRRPSECTAAQKKEPGTVKSVAIVYEGEDAVAKCRRALGPTDPRKAPPGSIRREFGQNIMVNTAHASDSPENAVREIRVLNIAENNLKTVIKEFYKNC